MVAFIEVSASMFLLKLFRRKKNEMEFNDFISDKILFIYDFIYFFFFGNI